MTYRAMIPTPNAMICQAGKRPCYWPACLCPCGPHSYTPSTIHMGDCGICGRLQDDPIHPATPEPPTRLETPQIHPRPGG